MRLKTVTTVCLIILLPLWFLFLLVPPLGSLVFLFFLHFPATVVSFLLNRSLAGKLEALEVEKLGEKY